MSTVHLDGGGVVAARDRAGSTNKATWSAAEKKLRAAAGELVGQAFFAPLLAQMRNSPFKTEMSSGGKGAEAFGQMMDEQTVKHMAGGAGRLTDVLVKRMLSRAEAVEAAREAKKLAAEGAALKGQEVGNHVDIAG